MITKELNHYCAKIKQDKIPSLIGCFIADKIGRTLLKFEIFEGALEYFIKRDISNEEKKEEFDLELIPMFVTALEQFSEQINVQDLSGVNFCGTNIKMQALFNFNSYTVIFFLSPDFSLKSIENKISDYFINFFEKYKRDLNDKEKISTIHFRKSLEIPGKKWLNSLNQSL